MPSKTIQKTILIAASIMFVTTVFLLAGNFALAEEDALPANTETSQSQAGATTVNQATGGAGNSLGDIVNSASNSTNSILGFFAKGTAAVVMTVATGILYIILAILVVILYLVSAIFNTVFLWTLTLDPAMPAVLKGWTFLRDAANSFFILITVWIAITIIFDLENLGGKKLLIRVLIFALLINFSLAMVTATFGFTNALTRAIAQKMPVSPGDFIVKATDVTTVLKDYNQGSGNSNQPAGQTPGGTTQKSSYQNGRETIDSLLTSIGIETARGQFEDPTAHCGNPIKGKGPTPEEQEECAKNTRVTAVLNAGVNWFFDGAMKRTIMAFLSILFVLVVIATMALGAAALIMRMIAMIFLAVTAPAAFLMRIIPGGVAEEYWNKWIKNLFKWAFFAPMFYFCLYLSFFMLQQFDQALGAQTVAASSDLNRILEILIGLAFMIVSLKLARDSSGFIGDALTKLGKQVGTFALGAATGGAASVALGAAGAATRAAAPAVQAGLNKISGVPLLNTIASPLVRRTDKYLGSQKQQVSDYSSKVDHLSTDAKLRDFNGRTNLLGGAQKLGIAMNLAKHGELHRMGDNGIRNMLTLARQFDFDGSSGMALELLKAAPHLATAENIRGTGLPPATGATQPERDAAARRSVFEKIDNKTDLKPAQFATLNPDGTINTPRNESLDAVMQTMSADEWRRLEKKGGAQHQALKARWDGMSDPEKQALLNNSKPDFQLEMMKETPKLATTANVSSLPTGATNVDAKKKVLEKTRIKELKKEAYSTGGVNDNETLEAMWLSMSARDKKEVDDENIDVSKDLNDFFGGLNNIQKRDLVERMKPDLRMEMLKKNPNLATHVSAGLPSTTSDIDTKAKVFDRLDLDDIKGLKRDGYAEFDAATGAVKTDSAGVAIPDTNFLEAAIMTMTPKKWKEIEAGNKEFYDEILKYFDGLSKNDQQDRIAGMKDPEMQTHILKKRLHLIEPGKAGIKTGISRSEAIKDIAVKANLRWENVKIKDYTNPDTGKLDTEVLEEVYAQTTTKEKSIIAEKNPELFDEMKKHINGLSEARLNEMRAQMGSASNEQHEKYFAGRILGSAGIGRAWNKPAEWKEPVAQSLGMQPSGTAYDHLSGLNNPALFTGSLPPGLNLDYASGRLSGTPTTPGTHDFTISGTDPATSKKTLIRFTITIA